MNLRNMSLVSGVAMVILGCEQGAYSSGSDYEKARQVLDQYSFSDSPSRMEIFNNYRSYDGLKALAISPDGPIGDMLMVVELESGSMSDLYEDLSNSKKAGVKLDMGELALSQCNQHVSGNIEPCQLLMFNDEYVWDENIRALAR